MVPGGGTGGTQPLDNALLHATDLAGSGSVSYDGAVDETAGYSLNPSVAVLLKNATDTELNTFTAVQPIVAGVHPPQQQQHRRNNLQTATTKKPSTAAGE